MYIPFFTITPKITQDLEKIGAVFSYLKTVRFPQSYRKELVSKVTADIIHSSTAIEGNILTHGQVEDLLLGKKITAEKIDVQEVINYNKVLSYVEKLAKEEKILITEKLIKEINLHILKDINDDIAGRYRKKQVVVGDYIPPEYFKVPMLMGEFVGWINDPHPPYLSPILITGIAHYQLVAIHPFEDGNGRTTRVIITFMLIKYGYDTTSFFALESYYNRNRRAYYEALNSADKYRIGHQADLTKWLEYYVEGMLIEAERAQSRIEELLQESTVLTKKIWISDVQLKLLRLTKTAGTAKTADYLRVSGLSRKGTYNALENLVKSGLLKRIGLKKGAYYRITDIGLNYVK